MKINRRLELYSMAAHDGAGVIDYVDFFNRLSKLNIEERKINRKESILVISTINIIDDLVEIIFVEGDKTAPDIIFDNTKNSEIIRRLNKSQYTSERTHALFDMKKKKCAIEYNRKGIKSAFIAISLTEVGQKSLGISKLQFSLNPIPKPEFILEIERFSRIRKAEILLARPNVDWDDYAEPQEKLAEESGAGSIRTEVSAPRGGTLAKRRGVMQLIAGAVSAGRSNVADAKITGNRIDEQVESTISLRNFVTQKKVSLDVTSDGVINERSIFDRLLELIRSAFN